MVQDIKTFIHTHKGAVLLNITIVCICYLHMAFSMNIGIDTEAIVNDRFTLLYSWERIGRHGLVLTKMLLRIQAYNPYFAGFLFLTAFMALGILTAFFCWLSAEKNNTYPYGLFLILFSTCPVWMMQFYFALQRAEVVLGLIYAVISILCFQQFFFLGKRKIYLIPLYLIFGIWSFCSYQGSVIFYIALCIMAILLDFAEHYTEKRWQDYAGMILKMIGGFLVIFLLNTVITHLFFKQDTYLQGQIAWGQIPLSENIYRILIPVYHVFSLHSLAYRSAYPLACLCMAAVFFGFCLKKEIKKSMKILLLIILAGLLLTPFLLSIYMGSIPAPRSQFALQLVSAFGCMFACGVWKKEKTNKSLWLQRGTLAVSVISVWFSLISIFLLQYTDDVRYQEDLRVAESIAEDIRHTEGTGELPVIFVGQYNSKLNHSSYREDVYGASFLGWDYSPENQTGATTRIIGFMRTMGLDIKDTGALNIQEEALKSAEELTCYPSPGYISVEKDFVVVKLSELEEIEK